MSDRAPARTLLMVAALLTALAFITWKGARLLADSSVFPPDDFVEYWAAGRLNATGQNPYDGTLLLPLEQQAGRDTAEPIMMWNPPWTLTLVMPVGLLPARVAQLSWLVASLFVVVLSADQLWKLYGGELRLRWVAWLVSLTFVPTLFVLQAGQIGPLILLGITAFLVAERAGRPWLAGAAAVLLAIKPHLVYLFWVALAVWAGCRPWPTRGKVLLGGLIAGAVATWIPMLSNPDVLGQYWEAMTHRTPEQWKSPTIGSLLRELFGEDLFRLQFVPTALGIGWLAYEAWRVRRQEWDWAERMPVLLLVSFVTASYGAWPFDLVILLPGVILVAARLSVRGSRSRIAAAVAAYVSINAGALAMNLAGVTSDRFVWMAPTLLLAYLLLRQPAAAR